MFSDTAAVLALTLYGCIVLAVIGWQIRSFRQNWKAWILYIVQRLHNGLMFQWRSNRKCPFPDEGAGLIIANHSSPVDPMLVWMNHHLGSSSHRIRVFSFMMAKEYYEIPGLRWLCEALLSIPIDRAGKDIAPIKTALEHLKNGRLVAIFPEGKINLGEGLLEGITGAAWLALTAKVPIYPVYIHNSPRGNSMVEPFYRPTRVNVSYGDPFDVSEFYGQRKTQELLRKVTDLMMERLAELGGVKYRDERAYSDSQIDDVETIPMRKAAG